MKLSREKIEIHMARKQMNNTKLANAYGASRQRIQMILNQREVSVTVAGRMAAALGTDVTEILEE